jgi:SagB-type dehydrogenase family enzyme
MYRNPPRWSESRLRRARTLVLSFEGFCLVGFNFLTRQNTFLDEVDFALLSLASEWCFVEDVDGGLRSVYHPARLASSVQRLLSLGFLVAEGTPAGARDLEYEGEWAWGAMAGHYHFGIKDPYYMTPEDTSAWLVDRVTTKPVVPLYQTNAGLPDIVQLSAPPGDNGILSVMRRRRSYRGFDATKWISLDHVRDCLFSGFGITGFIETPIPGEGHLPLTMTPSGGARNPYEGYLYARRVERLKPGFYHYSALDNTLGLVTASDLPSVGDVLARQPWFDDAAAVILLVADFARTIWKYAHPTGFRVVLLEAGHIAQNILLTATAAGLASAPTCAISDSLTQGLLGLTSLTASVVYSVSVGWKSDVPTQADVINVLPNPYLPVDFHSH